MWFLCIYTHTYVFFFIGKADAGENAKSDFIQHLDWAAQVNITTLVNTENPLVSLQADVTTVNPRGG